MEKESALALGQGRSVQGGAGSPDVVDDEVRWGNEEVVYFRERCSDEVLTLASAGFRDHLRHRTGPC